MIAEINRILVPTHFSETADQSLRYASGLAVDGNVFGDDPLCAYEPGLAMPLPARIGTAEA
jgi:hypothetical protein